MRSVKSDLGFTLVEIMIVVAVIGLLAMLVMPNFVRSRTTARANSCINNLRLISDAKSEVALELGLTETTTPTTAQISPYFKTSQLIGGLPKEPENGTYTIGAISQSPTCSVGGAHAV